MASSLTTSNLASSCTSAVSSLSHSSRHPGHLLAPHPSPFAKFSGLKLSSSAALSSSTTTSLQQQQQQQQQKISRHLNVAATARVETVKKIDTALLEESVNTIRFLDIDAVGKAHSAHPGLPMRRDQEIKYGARAAKKGAPPMMPAIMTPAGPMDLSSVLLRNRIIFLGQPVNSQVAQRVISQLMLLAAVDENEDIKMYINCPGGSTYSVLAIYDCMSWIKPKVSTVCFGIAASQGALLLAGGEKGKRFAMPNARIMIHQPQGGCGGTMDDVRRQVNEVVASRDKIDKMYAAFTGQPLETVQKFTERDRFFSAAEAMEFGLIDGLLETEY